MESHPTFEIRRARAGDAGAMARMRVASSLERHAGDSAREPAYVRECRAFFERELANTESFLRSWLALAGDNAVGGASLAVLPTLPRFASPGAAHDGRVRDVFVVPEFRRRGVARALMAAVLAEAKACGIDRLSLGASALGMPLYETLGFVRKPDEMVYDSQYRP